MAVTKQGTALAAHIENKEWEKARALITSIINVQTLVKSGWLLVWNLPDVPGSLILLLLRKIKVLSHYQRKPFPIGMYPFMFQDKFSEFLNQAAPTSVQSFLIALSDTYRDTKFPKPNQLEEYIDTLWISYLGLPRRYSGGNRVTGNEEHIQAALRVHSLDDLQDEPELQSLWEKTEILLKAATGYNLEGNTNDEEEEDEWLVLHAIAQLDCLTCIMWFAIRLYPEQATVRRRGDGNTPLHISVTKPMYAMVQDNFRGPPVVHDERTMYPLELQETQDFMSVFMARTVPQAATYMNSNYHTPLIHFLLEYSSVIHQVPSSNHRIHSNLQYQLRLKELIGAAPQALASRDYDTQLYPFQTAAVANAPLDFIYTLFRGDPSALKYRRLTKREADYDRVLEENASLREELEKKSKYIQELQLQLKEYEKKSGTKSSPARKRTKRS